MSPARGVSIRSAKASISSVVVRPLPHSFAMSRKGALEMAAMDARRQSWGISIWPIFMMEPSSGSGYPIYTGRSAPQVGVADHFGGGELGRSAAPDDLALLEEEAVMGHGKGLSALLLY